MNRLHPSLKILLAFFLSFLATYSLINLITFKVGQREKLLHLEAAKTLQKEISHQFELMLDVSLVIGNMASVYIHQQDQNVHYGELVQKVLQEKDYIQGLNQLNYQGRIIHTYPQENNRDALGKVTQNYPELVESYQRGEKFWFSPPFELYQGGTGFVFYIPIKSKGKLLGWIAPVISSQIFFNHFRSMDFFSKYDLTIKDEETANFYFETGLPPKEQATKEIKNNMWGRNITFQSWPKASNPQFELPFIWRFLICLAVSLFCGLMMKIYLQKKKAYQRLENIRDVLKLTSNEVLSKLMDIQNNYLSLGADGFLSTNVVEKDIQSVTNLIEQIELLQNIASSEQIEEETFEILPLIKEHLELLQEVVPRKNLKLKLDAESFLGIKVTGNKWLVSNTVLKNALSYSALISQPDGRIEVSHTVSPRECSTIFHIEKVIEREISQTFKIERRLLVARNVMELLDGHITIHEDGAGGIILKLSTQPLT